MVASTKKFKAATWLYQGVKFCKFFYGGFIAVLEVCLGHDFINSLAFKLRKLKAAHHWLEKS